MVAIGSACEVLDETAAWLNQHGEKVGVLQVALYGHGTLGRSFWRCPTASSPWRCWTAPRTGNPPGEPLYLDVVTSYAKASQYGKATANAQGGRRAVRPLLEVDPAMAKAVFDALKSPEPKEWSTVGIVDDVSGTSLPVDAGFDIESEAVRLLLRLGRMERSVNKNTAKDRGAVPGRYAQGYFVYDSKEVRLLHHLPSPLRSQPYPGSVLAEVGELRRRPLQIRLPVRGGRPCGKGRPTGRRSSSTAPTARRRFGTEFRRKHSRRLLRAVKGLRHRRFAGGPASSGWPLAPTPFSRLSSPCPE